MAERVCSRFDFEAAAARLGMHMAIDGSGDELIRIQGTKEWMDPAAKTLSGVNQIVVPELSG